MTFEMMKGIVRTEIERTKTILPLTPIQTTDNTDTALISIPTISGENGIIKYTVIGLVDDGATGLAIERIFRYHNDGTLTIGTEQDILVDNDITGSGVGAAVNSLNIEIVVTGLAGTNINWIGQYEKFNQTVEVLGT